ncbi:MAG TPA: RsmB/NOP family class I SAM-dependent RNA methyltransferase [Candidatus Lokiarchaeia archaeon]
MIERYISFLGVDETIELLKANERPLIPSIRVNTLKIEPNKLREKLEIKGFELEPIEWVPYAFKVKKGAINIGSTHEYLQGYYYLQNVASMLPSIILDPKPNELVIDMCASPGSKSTHLAQIMENKGTLILIERNKKRIPALEINVRRMGIINTIILNMDAINIKELNVQADKVLLDAPCTGEGLIREDFKRKKSKNVNDIEKMASVQIKLLEAGLTVLKAGGYLLYSTCSIAPEENELVIDQVLKKNSSMFICEILPQFGVNGLVNVYGKALNQDLKFSQRIYPHIHDTIGFYICLIKKK